MQAWGRFLRLAASPSVAARDPDDLRTGRACRPSHNPCTHARRFAARRAVLGGERPCSRRSHSGGEFVDVPGIDYGLAVGDVDPLIDEVEAFVTGTRPAHDVDRVLATVLFTDIVDSTSRAAHIGDRGWRTLLDSHEEMSREEVETHGGRIADFTGDGLLAHSTVPRAPCAARSRCKAAPTPSASSCALAFTRERSNGAVAMSPGSASISPRASWRSPPPTRSSSREP